MKSSDLFVQCLEKEGVTTIFGVPGEENLDLLESIRTSKIQFITTRHEQGAVFMAATYGRLTGKAGVALATLGPGATNMVTAIAHAQLCGFPLVVITGQKPVKKRKQGAFQVIDVVAMMRPITKAATTLASGDRIPTTIRNAFHLAQSEKSGAVHIELPEDIAREETKVEALNALSVSTAGADMEAVKKAADFLERSKSPILLIAAGANRIAWEGELQTFLYKTGMFFATTQMGKGVMDETSPKYLGTTALSASDYVHCALGYTDLILVLGHDIIEKPPAMLSEGKEIIHISSSAAEAEDGYVPTLEVLGDLRATLRLFTDAVQPSSAWDFSYFTKAAEVFRPRIQERSDSDAFPVKPQRLVKELREALSEDGMLALDNGMYKLWIARNFPCRSQNGVLLDNALATMGGGLPVAVSAKLVYPDRKVIAVVGDGGFLMTVAELETAKRLGLDIVIVVVNDGGYGMIEWKQNGMGLPEFGMKFGNPDFVQLAESFGAKGYRMTKTEELGSFLTQTANAKGIHVIDCPVDYSENARVFDEELENKTCDV